MEETVLGVILAILLTVLIVILYLDLSFGCLKICNQVHQVAFFKPSLVVHEVSNPLHRSEIAQISLLGKCGCKGPLIPVE